MAVQIVDMPAQDVCAYIRSEADQRLYRSILQLFEENGLTYKIKSCGRDLYRIYCFIKKGKEALIINTKWYTSQTFSIQLRILDPSVFEKLDTYSDRVRSLILNSKDCRMPHCEDCRSEYVFTHGDKTYKKCHMLCDNFKLQDLNDEDHGSVLQILRDEIAFGRPGKRAKAPK